MGKLKQFLIENDISLPLPGDWTEGQVYAMIREKENSMTKCDINVFDAVMKKSQPRRKSTTHEEQYYHVRIPDYDLVKGKWISGGTVFFRKEKTGWVASVARCSVYDQFNRKKGRNVARRRYFLKGGKYVEGVPTYELAERLVFDVNW